MPNGIDISTWQGEIDFNALKKSGEVDFVYARATEGVNYVDDMFNHYHDECKRVGLPFGAYHFLHMGGSPVEQAEHFLRVTDGRIGTLIPMVDVEGEGMDGVHDLSLLVARLAAFNKTVEAELGSIIIYTDYGDWNGYMQGTDAFAGHKLWIAEYNSDPEPTLPGGFEDYVIWQHSSSGTFPGIEGRVDCDSLNPKYTLADITRV